MYILGAAILVSGFAFSKGQMNNYTEIVYVFRLKIIKDLVTINSNNDPKLPLETLTDADLYSIGITCAEMSINDCSAMILKMYGEASSEAE